VERYEIVTCGRVGIGGGGGERGTGPDVAERNAEKGGARRGPDGVEALDECMPESRDGDSAAISIRLAFCLEKV
jgi:hypothetical protein